MYNTINYKQYTNLYEDNPKGFKLNNIHIQTNAFLQLACELLGNTNPPPRNVDGYRSIKEWYKNLPERITFRNEEWTKESIIHLLEFLVKIPFGQLSPQPPQIKGKYWNSSVPFFMYGQRLINGIPYDEWNIPENRKYCLPSVYKESKTSTSNIVAYYRGKDIELMSGPSVVVYITSEELLQLRSLALDDTRNHKRHDPNTHLVCNTWKGSTEEEETEEGGVEHFERMCRSFDSLSKGQRQALLQLWIFQPHVRLENKGLFNLQNWDDVPAPIYDVEGTLAPTEQKDEGDLW